MPQSYSEEFKQECVRLYVEEGLSGRQIEDRKGVHNSTVLRWVRDSKGESRSKSRAQRVRSFGDPDEIDEKVYTLYVRKAYSTAKVADELGLSAKAVRDSCQKQGILRSPSRGAQLAREPADDPDYERALRLYRAGNSIRKVADFIERPIGTVQNWLDREGMTRSRSEAQKERYDTPTRRKREKAMCRAYARGKSFREVADQFDVSYDKARSAWYGKNNPYKNAGDGKETLTPA